MPRRHPRRATRRPRSLLLVALPLAAATALTGACASSSTRFEPDMAVGGGPDAAPGDVPGDGLVIVGDEGDVEVLELTGESAEVPAGGTANLTVVMSGRAPTGGAIVELASSDPEIAEVGQQIVVPGGASRASVPVTGKRPGRATITARRGREASFEVEVVFGAGTVAITEFRAVAGGPDNLDGEFVELYNRISVPVRLAGWTLKVRASAPQALTSSAGAGAELVIEPGAYLVCVPAGRPAGARPEKADCVYGAGEAQPLTLNDQGDVLELTDERGTLVDQVDFTNVVGSPTVPPPALAFAFAPGRSVQLDGARRPDARDNDNPLSWCIAFRVSDTAGAANERCQQVVINEVLYDAAGADGAKEFIELAGPGGANLSAFRIRVVNGNTGESTNLATIPMGTRMPASGLYVVADGQEGSTLVKNASFVATLGIRNNNGALQLLSAEGNPLDVVGFGTLAHNQDMQNQLPTRESFPVAVPTSGDTWAFSIARDASSTDTNDNSRDFRVDPTPTPGRPNDEVVPALTALSPADAPAVAVASIEITGEELVVGATLDLDTGTPGACNVLSPTRAVCTVGPRPAGAGVVDAVLVNGFAGGTAMIAGGFRFTEDVPAGAPHVDACQVESPASFEGPEGSEVEVTARVSLAGVTGGAGAGPGILVQVGGGPRSQDPRTTGLWTWRTATFAGDDGSDDLYRGRVSFPQSGTFAYAARASTDGGTSWVYCDLAPGAADGFSLAAAGLARITP